MNAFKTRKWTARARGLCGVVGFGLLAAGAAGAAGPAPQPRFNVLLIALDDFNDWAGDFGGYPRPSTPQLDRLARGGGTVFANALCPGPVCGPSRSALLSGFGPHRTGVYGNNQNMVDSPLVRAHATLPEYFAQHGYFTLSRGKIFHRHPGDQGEWAFQRYDRNAGSNTVDRARLYSMPENVVGGVELQPRPVDPESARNQNGVQLSWGPTTAPKEDVPDYRTALWAAERLAQLPAEPFFMAVGFFKPHLPWFVPQEYFDRHPLDTITIPPHRLDDLDDVRTPQGKKAFEAGEEFLWVRRDEQLFKRAIQGYLAASSFVDDCVGVVLDALERSPARDHTIVVVFGDHGWHFGEKLRIRKATLWAEATRLPLIIRVPGRHAQKQVSSRVVNLQDLYPTLIELCGLPAKSGIDGRSLAPLLRDAQTPWPHPGVVINGRGNACARDERWYFIRHDDGTEEFYDMQHDPQQWTNLAGTKDRELRAHMERLAAALPKIYAAPVKPRGGAEGAKQPKRDLKALK